MTAGGTRLGGSVVWRSPVDETLARVAGEVLGELRLGREHTIDAIVMASAAQRGDTVYTSDFDDMSRLGTRFPGLSVSIFIEPRAALSHAYLAAVRYRR